MVNNAELRGFDHLIRVKPENINFQIPPSLQIGDYNLDGYPDALIVMSDNSINNRKIILLDNTPCISNGHNNNSDNNNNNNKDYSSGSDACWHRTLSNNMEIIPLLDSMTEVYAVTFFDFGDDVSLDLLVISKNNDDSDDYSTSIITIPNNLHDSFFAKVFVLNGRCISWCRDGKYF